MTGTGIEMKIAGTILKLLIYPAIVWLFYPLYDFIVPLIVYDYVLLSPYMKSLLEDIKIILGVLVALFVLVKLIYGVIKIKKEIQGKQ